MAYYKIFNYVGYKITSLYIKPTKDLIKKNFTAIVNNIGHMVNMESCDGKMCFIGRDIFEFILFYLLTNLGSLTKDEISEIFNWLLKGPIDKNDAMDILN